MEGLKYYSQVNNLILLLFELALINIHTVEIYFLEFLMFRDVFSLTMTIVMLSFYI